MTDSFDWTGRVGDVWASEWRRTDRSFADLSRHLDATILAAAPAMGRALDVGCGAGGTALALVAARPNLTITGIDLSENLIAVARDRASGHPNLRFLAGDASSLGDSDAPNHHAGLVPASAGPQAGTDRAGGFDLIFSRHGVMFFVDPVAGFAALHGVAAPGASLVFSCFRPRTENLWAMTVDAAVGNDPPPSTGYAPGPYGLADRAFTALVLERAGWRDVAAHPVDFTYVAGASDDPAGDALDFFSRIGSAARTLADTPPDRRSILRKRLRAAVENHITGDTVTFPAAAWIWTATAAGERP
jgi:SAM-dependent methyltransferase